MLGDLSFLLMSVGRGHDTKSEYFASVSGDWYPK